MMSSPISLSSMFITLNRPMFTAPVSAASPAMPPCSSHSSGPETWSKIAYFFPHFAAHLPPTSASTAGSQTALHWTIHPFTILYTINYPPLFHLILLSIILLALNPLYPNNFPTHSLLPRLHLRGSNICAKPGLQAFWNKDRIHCVSSIIICW